MALAEVTPAQIDAVFAELGEGQRPGCSVAVVQNGEVVFAHGYGFANLEYGIANAPETIFRIGSTSKQFTASCVLLAAADGKLALADDVRKWVPELPAWDEGQRPATIRDLMHHTSGIRDYLTLMAIRGMGDLDYYTTADVLDLLGRQAGLDFAPGAHFSYSNSGYLLLGVIVERATGSSLRAYAHDKLFEPLGMHKSFYCDDTTEIVPLRAEGYVPLDAPESGYAIGRTILNLVGDGGVFTSVLELAKWDANFSSHKVGGAALHAAQHEVGTLNSGTELDYAAGLFIDTYRGLRRVSHGGAFTGFRAELMRFPDQRLSVICLSNDDSGEPTRWCQEVADLYIGPADTEAPDGGQDRERGGSDASPQPSPDPASFAGIEGHYFSSELDKTATLEVRPDGLYYKVGHADFGPMLLTEKGDHTTGGYFRLTFERDADGQVDAFDLGAGRAKGLLFTRVE